MRLRNNLSNGAEYGGALVYVFIGVVLLALLSITFGRGTSTTPTRSLTSGQSKVIASDILNYTNGLTKAVNGLILKGCSENQISFETEAHPEYDNPDAPGDESCHVFSAAGGKMTWQEPPAGANDGSTWAFVGGPVMHTRGGEDSSYDTENADLVVYLFSLTESVCTAIDLAQGIDDIPVNGDDISAPVEFVGDYLEQDNVTGIAGAAQPSPCLGTPAEPHMCGKSAACFQEETGSERYIFVRTLLNR